MLSWLANVIITASVKNWCESSSFAILKSV